MKAKSKKGDVTDILSFVVILFVIITGFFIISFIVPYITNGFRTAGLDNSPQGINAINKLDDFGLNGIQRGVFWIFLGLFVSVLISSFYADTHPVWMFLYIFFLITTVIISAYLANAYETMINLNAFNGWTQTYMTTILQHIVLIEISLACLSFIIIFTKRSILQ